jgi:D-cysteine desulfhydrase
MERPLLSYLPALERRVHCVALGRFPTRVQPLAELLPGSSARDAYVKREDESAEVYGGNKVRTLEFLFGEAHARGARRIYSTGAFGSNHAAATVLHAPRVGLESGALLFPQPPSRTARDNLELVASRADRFEPLAHWSFLPFAMSRLRRREPESFVMAPGGAVPLDALGYVSAAIELAEQVRGGTLPAPERIVVGLGSTCTSAGLLVGLRVARRLGIAFSRAVPRVVSIRVSPWPVTSPLRVAHLARRTSRLLAELAGDPRLDFGFTELLAGLTVDPRFIGAGYGRVTETGLDAIRRFDDFGRQALDTTYSAKSAAGFLGWVETHPGATLYWTTKSSRPLPAPDEARLSRLPRAVRAWLETCPRPSNDP